MLVERLDKLIWDAGYIAEEGNPKRASEGIHLDYRPVGRHDQLSAWASPPMPSALPLQHEDKTGDGRGL